MLNISNHILPLYIFVAQILFPLRSQNNLYRWKKWRNTQQRHSKICFFFFIFLFFFRSLRNPILFVRYSHIFCMKSLRLKLITQTVIKLKYLHRFESRQKKDKSEPNISQDQSGNVIRIEKIKQKKFQTYIEKNIRSVLNNLRRSIKNSQFNVILFVTF